MQKRIPALFSTAGSIFSAALSTACCSGPLLVTALGITAGTTGVLGGLAGLIKTMIPYRPLFIVLTIGLLAAAFLRAYRIKGESVEPSTCAITANQRMKQIVWLTALIAGGLLLLPTFLTWRTA